MPIWISRLNHDGPWQDDLLGCPSQCYRAFTWSSETHFLYLRWRWEDPWQGHVVRVPGIRTGEELSRAGAEPMGFAAEWPWSPDLLERAGKSFAEDDIESAKVEMDRQASGFLSRPDWLPVPRAPLPKIDIFGDQP